LRETFLPAEPVLKQAKLSTWLTVVSRRLALDFLRAKYGRDFRLKKIRVVSYDAPPVFKATGR